MKEASIRMLRRLKEEDIRQNMPILVTIEDEPFALVCCPKDVIFLNGLAPAMQEKLKNLYAIARVGHELPVEPLTKAELEEVEDARDKTN